MNEQLEKLMELPGAARAGIASMLVAVFCGGYYSLFIADAAERLDTLKKDVETRKVEIQQKETVARNLNKFVAEVDRLDVELKKALAELPDKKEMAQLLQKISDKARDSGLDIKLFSPQAERLKDFYAEVPIEIQVSGSYHQVGSFFDEVGRLERIVNLDGVTIKDPKSSEAGMQLTTSVYATSFRFLDEKERPMEQESAKGKKRRKAKKASADDE